MATLIEYHNSPAEGMRFLVEYSADFDPATQEVPANARLLAAVVTTSPTYTYDVKWSMVNGDTHQHRFPFGLTNARFELDPKVGRQTDSKSIEVRVVDADDPAFG